MSLTPAAEITRAETGQRSRLLRVRSYDVALDLTRGAETFGSVSLVRFDCAERGAASHADLVARAVHEITLNGVPLDPAAVWADGRITLPALAAHNELQTDRPPRWPGCCSTASNCSRRLASDFPRGTLVSVPGAKMWVPVDSPAAVADAIAEFVPTPVP